MGDSDQGPGFPSSGGHELMRTLLLAVLAVVVTSLWPALPAAQQQAPAARIVHTDPATFRMSAAVHGGAGSMGFTSLLNRGAVTPEFNFLHRGVIPPGAGIGHHFHNVVEEMFVILDGEAQFTIDGRTATVKGPRSEEHTSELQSRLHLVCRLLLEKK